MKIVVVGLGYVAFNAVLLAQQNQVIGVDIWERVNLLIYTNHQLLMSYQNFWLKLN